ncbi:MAG: hypothetical protein ACJAZX_000359 [Rickettsiales bacterium]
MGQAPKQEKRIGFRSDIDHNININQQREVWTETNFAIIHGDKKPTKESLSKYFFGKKKISKSVE